MASITTPVWRAELLRHQHLSGRCLTSVRRTSSCCIGFASCWYRRQRQRTATARRMSTMYCRRRPRPGHSSGMTGSSPGWWRIPPSGPATYGISDLQPIMLSIGGTDFNNMTITSIQVLQASPADVQTNLTRLGHRAGRRDEQGVERRIERLIDHVVRIGRDQTEAERLQQRAAQGPSAPPLAPAIGPRVSNSRKTNFTPRRASVSAAPSSTSSSWPSVSIFSRSSRSRPWSAQKRSTVATQVDASIEISPGGFATRPRPGRLRTGSRRPGCCSSTRRPARRDRPPAR